MASAGRYSYSRFKHIVRINKKQVKTNVNRQMKIKLPVLTSFLCNSQSPIKHLTREHTCKYIDIHMSENSLIIAIRMGIDSPSNEKTLYG